VRKTLIAALSVLPVLAILVGGGEWWVRALSGAFFSAVLLVVAILYRRFARACPEAPWACHVSAAVSVAIGVGNVISGVGHSAAVASLALREPGYGPLQILRFTTGAMLLYSGAMNIALGRAIAAGRRSAIGAGVASGVLFQLYLVFTLPLRGSGGSVSRELALWTIHVLWLVAAATAIRQRKMVPA
jgi:hypothetical protein